MVDMATRWLHRSAMVVPPQLRWSAHDSRISATFVDGTTTFGRTARGHLKAPMQPDYTLLTARTLQLLRTIAVRFALTRWQPSWGWLGIPGW